MSLYRIHGGRGIDKHILPYFYVQTKIRKIKGKIHLFLFFMSH